jgi:formamidopyrimidine-DNA glycosylase
MVYLVKYRYHRTCLTRSALVPELPEVEVSRLGISPHLLNQTIDKIILRRKQLRWPIPEEVLLAQGHTITDVRRRAKYLLIDTLPGSIILHLGMSGRLRVVDQSTEVIKHDHVDIVLSNGKCLRFNDARRFGACLWQAAGEQDNKLLSVLGPEPLTDDFSEDHLFRLSRGRIMPIKNFIMDNKMVVGVGNIYANESLFLAGIDPRRQATKVSRKRYAALTVIIKQVLAKAILQGGTTLKDFTQADGSPGYFAQELLVYGRKGKKCVRCDNDIYAQNIGQRNTFFCKRCQT